MKWVTRVGAIRFKTRLLSLSTALKQRRIGLEVLAMASGPVFLGKVLLGRIDERQGAG